MKSAIQAYQISVNSYQKQSTPTRQTVLLHTGSLAQECVASTRLPIQGQPILCAFPAFGSGVMDAFISGQGLLSS